jgi:hypothetical protein
LSALYISVYYARPSINQTGGVEAVAYQTRTTEAWAAVDQAQQAVKDATEKYSRGGSLDAVNKANRKLANCHAAADRVSGGLALDDR